MVKRRTHFGGLVNHFLHVVKVTDVDGYSVGSAPCFTDFTFDCADGGLLRVGVGRERFHGIRVGRALRCHRNCMVVNDQGKVTRPFKDSPAYPLLARSIATCLPIPLDAPTINATGFVFFVDILDY